MKNCFSPLTSYTIRCTKHGYSTATKSIITNQYGKAASDFYLNLGGSENPKENATWVGGIGLKTEVGTSQIDHLRSEVVFTDPMLETVIRASIGKPNGIINIVDLDRLSSLFADDEGIKDIAGLESCIKLKELSLEGNQISDTSPLSGLTNLKGLDLAYNHIEDASPLYGLPNLKFMI